MLHQVLGCDGFSVSTSLGWTPDHRGIGEPDPIDADVAVHVFGRHPDESVRPVRAMSVPRSERSYVPISRRRKDLIHLYRAALQTELEPLAVVRPNQLVCDGCAPEVLTNQERCRSEGVRVIRPHLGLIDPHVLILPLRHVSSLRDLNADEVQSMSARLAEASDQFRHSNGSTGLSCFANDGVRSRQETPHVHLHVYGRSKKEPANPFELLLDRLSSAKSRPESA